MLGGVEAGGTKFVCAIARTPALVVRRTSFATTAPAATLAQVVGFFKDCGGVAALGVGSFGPLDLDPGSGNFGAIRATPKPLWSGFNLRAELAAALGCCVAIDTDVNASGLAEARMGAGRFMRVVAYVTVGTGIGGGLLVDGVPLLGLTHPEMGHIRLARHELDREFPGCCPFHGDCLEGLASGAAIYARTGANLTALSPGHELWAVIPDYLGQFCAQLVLMCSPEVIVLGGGVMGSNPELFEPVRAAMQRWLGGYGGAAAAIVPPSLGDDAGIIGALMMAQAGLGEGPNSLSYQRS